eukprot:Rhum_TRINITY_DN14314_c7_g3::Rhum_TRINITY_DN14314_c7_g3_i1::g.80625::m.80625
MLLAACPRLFTHDLGARRQRRKLPQVVGDGSLLLLLRLVEAALRVVRRFVDNLCRVGATHAREEPVVAPLLHDVVLLQVRDEIALGQHSLQHVVAVRDDDRVEPEAPEQQRHPRHLHLRPHRDRRRVDVAVQVVRVPHRVPQPRRHHQCADRRSPRPHRGAAAAAAPDPAAPAGVGNEQNRHVALRHAAVRLQLLSQVLQRDGKLALADVAQHVQVELRAHDREAGRVALEHRQHFRHRLALAEDGHLLRVKRDDGVQRRVRRHIVAPLEARVQERQALVVHQHVVDAVLAAQELRAPLRAHHTHGNGNDVGKAARQLEHDHDERKRHAVDAAHDSRGADDTVHGRDEARHVHFLAHVEGLDAEVVALDHLVEQQAGVPPQARACRQVRHEKPGRHHHAEAQRGQEELQHAQRQRRVRR